MLHSPKAYNKTTNMKSWSNCVNCGKLCTGRSYDMLGVPVIVAIFGMRVGWRPFCCGPCCNSYYQLHPVQSAWRKFGFTFNLVVLALGAGLVTVNYVTRSNIEALGHKDERQFKPASGFQTPSEKQDNSPHEQLSQSEPTTFTEWINFEGKMIKAKLLSFDGRYVHLHLENGNMSQYPLQKLSPASREKVLGMTNLGHINLVGFGRVTKPEELGRVNVRAAASLDSQTIAILSAGDAEIPVITEPVRRNNENWVKVLASGSNKRPTEGWVNSRYVETTPP